MKQPITYLVGLSTISPGMKFIIQNLIPNMTLVRIAALIIILILASTAFAQTTNSKIHSVDFANFTYPWVSSLGNPNKSFTLKNGELPATRNKRGMIDNMGISLANVRYGDVTGDGTEEAIVFLSLQTGGSSIPGILYIYSRQNNRLKRIWAQSTGDRADGGFRGAYAENGNFVLELNNPNESRGDCCPTKFERTRYRWNGKKFLATEKIILPIAENN